MGIPSEIRVAVVAQPVSTEKKIGVYLRKSRLQWLLNQFQPKKNLGIPSKIRVAVVAQPVSTILGSLPNYTFGNQGCSGCSTSFNPKRFGYTFENQGCSGCSTSFNHS